MPWLAFAALAGRPLGSATLNPSSLPSEGFAASAEVEWVEWIVKR